jgi:hypothetical protein
MHIASRGCVARWCTGACGFPGVLGCGSCGSPERLAMCVHIGAFAVSSKVHTIVRVAAILRCRFTFGLSAIEVAAACRLQPQHSRPVSLSFLIAPLGFPSLPFRSPAIALFSTTQRPTTNHNTVNLCRTIPVTDRMNPDTNGAQTRPQNCTERTLLQVESCNSRGSANISQTCVCVSLCSARCA